MKILYLLPLLLLPLFAPGCATLDKWILPTVTATNEVSIPITPDAEPLVIRAEVLARTSRDIVNAFVMFVNTNQAVLSQHATGAGMIQIKDQLVQKFPQAWRDFRVFTALYKESRTQGNRDLLGSSLEGIRTLVTMAEVHLAGGVLYPAGTVLVQPTIAEPPPSPQRNLEMRLENLQQRLDASDNRGDELSRRLNEQARLGATTNVVVVVVTTNAVVATNAAPVKVKARRAIQPPPTIEPPAPVPPRGSGPPQLPPMPPGVEGRDPFVP